MVDEAHRTQYGVLGARMSKALPNAVLIGFTGTPIDHGYRRSTMRRFGPTIDSYTIPQSVEDGATVPIHYGLIGFQWGVTVARRSQLGFPA